MPLAINTKALDALYERYNRREFVDPDPLLFLYDYDDPRDREIAALIASSLAYGRVAQIMRSVSSVLDRMPRPAAFVERASFAKLREMFDDFKHRFTTGEELATVLRGVKRVMKRFGSMHECFADGMKDEDETVLPALSSFVRHLANGTSARANILLAEPASGSACKRLNLFLRWMVRRDAVDPGGWDRVPASKLVIPLDTHMHRIGLALGMTERKQANTRTALDITSAFRQIAPDDPVRYDFSLTRLGIRGDGDLSAFLHEYTSS